MGIDNTNTPTTQALIPEADTACHDLGVVVREGKVVVSSRDVAKKFGKLHKNVLRDIENLECSRSFTELNFEPSEYTDPTGRKLPEVLMTRDGFTFLAMGFTGAKAAQFKEAYISEFNRMEAALTNPQEEPVELLLSRALLIAQEEVKRAESKASELESRLKADEPFANYGKLSCVAKGCTSIGEYAKHLTQNGFKIGRNNLFKFLREQEIVGRVGQNHNIPNQQYMERGYFWISRSVETNPKGSKERKPTTYLTPKGKMWLQKRLGVKPKMETLQLPL